MHKFYPVVDCGHNSIFPLLARVSGAVMGLVNGILATILIPIFTCLESAEKY